VDWFTALEAPTQVAIIGVVTALIAAMAGVAVAIVNNRKAGGGKAEIAALTIETAMVTHVASALEALNVSITELTKIAEHGGGGMVQVLGDVAKEVEELRREVRALSDKMRGS
jgi:ABC-type spermidine/putrescine transport system permease subunit II